MTTHFTPEQFVDAMEQPLSAERQAHLSVCRDCANQLAEMRMLMGDVSLAGNVPEPSPLFWNHLSARVRDAVDAQPVPVASWWRGWGRFALIAGALGAVVLTVSLRTASHVSSGRGPAADSAIQRGGTTVLSSESEAMFGMIETLAASMRADQAFDAGLAPGGAATDAAIDALSPAQRRELMRLLRAEMGAAE